ncbi:MAG: hypothetical protein HY658_01170 [Actinobacteria bacterium]|nr:hypothetical protein [Actinomycetota bacterium]
MEDSLIRRATGLLEAGQAEGAAEMVRTALAVERDPSRSVGLMKVLADALVVLGDLAGALNVLREAASTVGADEGAAAGDIARRTARALILGRRRLRGPAIPGGAREAEAWSERLLAMGHGGNPAFRAEGELLLALTDGFAGLPSRARTHALRATQEGIVAGARLPPDFGALLGLAWWLADEPREAIGAIDRLGRDGRDARSVRAVARFEMGEVQAAATDASVAWDGRTVPAGLEALGGLLAWPSSDPALAGHVGEAMAAAHLDDRPVPLAHLSLSLASRALLRSGRRSLAQQLARDVGASVHGGWPRGAAAHAFEVLENVEALAAYEDGSVASFRHRRLEGAHALEPDTLVAVGRRFRATGFQFEAAESLAAAGRAALARGDEQRGKRLLSEAAERYEAMAATTELTRVRSELQR